MTSPKTNEQLALPKTAEGQDDTQMNLNGPRDGMYRIRSWVNGEYFANSGWGVTSPLTFERYNDRPNQKWSVTRFGERYEIVNVATRRKLFARGPRPGEVVEASIDGATPWTLTLVSGDRVHKIGYGNYNTFVTFNDHDGIYLDWASGQDDQRWNFERVREQAEE